MFKSMIVLGGGSAGLMAALAVKTRMPEVSVTVLRSPEIGVIGVGESTTPSLPRFLFDYLKIDRRRFYALANPTWKLAVHFLWGPRGSFNYTFERQLEAQITDLPRPLGFYCDEDCNGTNQADALINMGKAFIRQKTGEPGIKAEDPFHLENTRYVKALETFALERGVAIVDGKMTHAEKGPQGIAALHLEDGRRLEADFFIDASGFRSELLGRALEEPFISYGSSLFNDRALVGSWPRTDEPIHPYTTAETMNAGWCWRIEHEESINRGYVYCSNFISDDQAREEFQRLNPRAKLADRPLKFRTGRYRRGWVDNVLAIGNSSGFVEPLESSALMIIAEQCQRFTEMVRNTGITPSIRDLYNHEFENDWDEIRNFLVLHFWPNTLRDTPYWRHCNRESDLSGVKPLLDFYQENGPAVFGAWLLRSHSNIYGIDGFLVLLVGNKVPYRNHHQATERERSQFEKLRSHYRGIAENGVTVKEALAYVRHPHWRWAGEN